MAGGKKTKSNHVGGSFVAILVVVAVGLCYLGQADWVTGDEGPSAGRGLYALSIRGPNRVGGNGCCAFRAMAVYDDRTYGEVTYSAIWSVEPNTYGSIDECGVLRTEDVNETQEITVRVEYTEGGVTMGAEKTVRVQAWRDDGLYVPRDYPTVQAAIDAASDGDIVVILPGRYKGEGNRDIDIKGKEISVRGTEPWDPNVVAATIIDCNGSETEPHRGFRIVVEENAILSGVTVTNGYVWGGWHIGTGGGILCFNGEATIANCVIKSNTGMWGGGISCIQGGHARIINCTINSNLAHAGGGVLCHASSAMITGCSISGNSTMGDSHETEISNWGGGVWFGPSDERTLESGIINCAIGGNSASVGGGICCWAKAKLVVDGCVIRGNKVEEDMFSGEQNGGGGILGCGGPIRNCTISENISEGEYGGGGLMFCDGPISKCTISYNSATGGLWGESVRGGGLYECNGPITDCNISYNLARSHGGGLSECDGAISDCFVRGNYAQTAGGGLDSCNGAISDCVISGNGTLRPGGSGLHLCEGPITNCTVVGNCCENGDGGGLAGCTGRISNCIIWGNLARHDTQQLSYCSEPNYSCIQGWTGGGVGNTDLDPCFVDGGSGYWHDNNTPDRPHDDFWVWSDGDYRLLEGSPCIDAGDPNYAAGPNETDLDGNPRVVGGRIDMGAYEYQGACVPPAEPSGPEPADGAIGVPIDTSLLWNGGLEIAKKSLASSAIDSAGVLIDVKKAVRAVTAQSVAGLNILYYWDFKEYETPDRLRDLGYNVTITSSVNDLARSNLQNYGVLWIEVFANPVTYESQASEIQQWVFEDGGGLVVVQPNYTGAQVTVFPSGFEVAVHSRAYDNLDCTIVDHSHPIVEGLTDADLSGNADTVRRRDIGSAWDIVAVEARSPDEVALLAGEYGRGRLCFSTGNYSPTASHPGSDECVIQMVDWLGSGEVVCPTMYEVYFGTEPSELGVVCSELCGRSCDPGLLEPCTRYYWQVVARSACGETRGPIWSFTTELCNTAPVACIVGWDRVVEAGEDCAAQILLDGSCSSDDDSTEGTNDDINDFDWYDVIDACDPNSDIYIGSGEVIECNLGLGEHLITLEVTDKAGAFDSNEVVITVEDVTPAEFSLSVEPNVLWPPNGKMVLVRLEWEVSDNCDEEVEVSLADISMSAAGDINDYVEIGDDGSIYLRARKGGNGRIYTLTYEAVDDSGNVAEASATVTVPHRRWLRRLGRGLVHQPGSRVYRRVVQRYGAKE